MTDKKMSTRERIACTARGEKITPISVVIRTPPPRNYIDELMVMIEACVRTGERCPFNWEISYGSEVFRALANAGKIRIEIYSLNWRVVEILTGVLAGKRTMEPPHGGVPYKVLGGGR